MSSNDPFSFLDDIPMDDEEVDELDSDSDETNVPQKRKAGSPTTSNVQEPSNGETTSNEPGPSVQKKPRFASPQPVVVDEFETEAKREVAASAGLTGGVEAGSRLELKHQVCSLAFFLITLRCIKLCKKGSSSSRGTSRI